MSITNILLTGRPGVGKTTVVEKVVKKLAIPVGGFYTREIRERGVRVGFRLSTWDGKGGIMSHVHFDSPFRVGKYGVDIRVIDEIGVPAIQEAMTSDKIIVIDELGRMELFSQKFQETVWQALEKKVPLLGVIQERPHPFLNLVRKRPDVELIPVTVKNRNILVDQLLHRLLNIMKYLYI